MPDPTATSFINAPQLLASRCVLTLRESRRDRLPPSATTGGEVAPREGRSPVEIGDNARCAGTSVQSSQHREDLHRPRLNQSELNRRPVAAVEPVQRARLHLAGPRMRVPRCSQERAQRPGIGRGKWSAASRDTQLPVSWDADDGFFRGVTEPVTAAQTTSRVSPRLIFTHSRSPALYAPSAASATRPSRPDGRRLRNHATATSLSSVTGDRFNGGAQSIASSSRSARRSRNSSVRAP